MQITIQEATLDQALNNPLVSAILDTTSDACVVIDAETRQVRQLNRRARELLGLGPTDEVNGCGCSDTLRASVCIKACPLSDAIDGNVDAKGLEVVYKGPNGQKTLHASTRLILVRAPDGRPLAGIEMFQDISENIQL